MTATDVLATVTGLIGLGAIGIAGAAAVRIRDKAAFIVAALIFIAASVVLLSTALSFAGLYRRGPILIAELVLLLVLGAIWWATGRPQPPRGWRRMLSTALAGARRHRSAAFITAAAALAFTVEAVLAVGVAPNNFDSMTYHLSRAAYWLQYESVMQFEGGSSWQLQYGPNAEILQAWTMLFTNGDRFAQLVQWLALIGTGCVIYAGARFLRFSRPASLLAGAVFVTFPLPVLEASSTQNDLVATFFVLSAALFVARGIAHRDLGQVVVAALSLGMAIGTKGTAFVAGPSLVLITAIALWRWRPPRRVVIAGALVLATGVVALGSVNYVQTAFDTGNPIGSAGTAETRSGPLLESGLRTMWSFVDAPGFAGSWIGDVVNASTQRAVGQDPASFAPFSGTEVEEDITGYGPLGLLMLLPLLLWSTVSASTSVARRTVAAAALLYIATHIVLLEPDPFASRTLMMGVALGAPLLARLEGVPWLRHATVLLATVFLIPALFQNYRKPLLPESILRLDRTAQQTFWSPREPTLRTLDEALAGTERVGVVSSNDGMDYLLFGPHFERYLVRRDFARDLNGDLAALSTLDFIKENDLDAVVWAEVPPPPDVRVPDIGPPGLSYFVYRP